MFYTNMIDLSHMRVPLFIQSKKKLEITWNLENLFFKLKFDIENIFKDPKLVYQKLFESNQPKALEDHVLC